MAEKRLAEIRVLLAGAGFELTPEDWSFFGQLRRRIRERNAVMNLTRLTGERDFFVKHLLDSMLPFLRLPVLRELGTGLLAADVGSGAGFPGFALARLRPSWDVALVERTRKRAAFLEETAAALDLSNVFVVPLDAAEAGRTVPLLRHRCDLAVARAVGRLDAVTRSAAPLLRPGGLLVHYKGGRVDPGELERGRRAARQLGLRMEEPVGYELPPDAQRSAVIAVAGRPSDRRCGAADRRKRARRKSRGGRER
ncbi:MAG: 16S rRNA (guanine(527)-N(7))-methyltransferase RsmG [Planctomycetota bacterium]